MAAGSIHIGSGPGVAGLSGMHVKLFVPFRSVRIFPSASIATIVACLPTFGGAADSALAISSASVGAAFGAAAGVSAPLTWYADMKNAAPIIRVRGRRDLLIVLAPLVVCLTGEARKLFARPI